MNEIILVILLLLLLSNVVLLFVLKSKSDKNNIEEVKNSFMNMESGISKIDNTLKDEFKRNREEQSNSLKNFGDSISQRMTEIASLQKNQLDTFSNQLVALTKSNEDRMDKLNQTVETKLTSMQEDNNQKLEKMRETVDERLQSTLEKRLGDSFRLVSERLEQVHKGLGEMQSLATGVGDLKKVLTNVKTRGIFGEGQLGNILEDILTVDQYSRNVKTKDGSDDNVEFAIKLPGRGDNNKIIWLPIDAKFPIEDYQILEEAYEKGDKKSIDESRKQLVNRIKSSAKYIKDKYLDPPNTTDFGIMFLPFESLHSEVLRNVGLIQQVQKEFKVVITGPANLSAFLNSLQMGFRTLAIEKRSSEVWELLGAVKTEFGNFGTILEKTKKKLDDASSNIELAGKRSRAIERKLRDVQELPKKEAETYLGTGLEKNDSENNQIDQTDVETSE